MKVRSKDWQIFCESKIKRTNMKRTHMSICVEREEEKLFDLLGLLLSARDAISAKKLCHQSLGWKHGK